MAWGGDFGLCGCFSRNLRYFVGVKVIYLSGDQNTLSQRLTDDKQNEQQLDIDKPIYRLRNHPLLRLAVGLLAGVLLTTSCTKGKDPVPAKTGGKRAVPVTAAPAVRKDVPLELITFGTVQAQASVAIKSQVSGILRKVHFEKGRAVASGDLLFTIESRAFEVALDQARATLARDKVQTVNAVQEAERIKALLAKSVAAQADVDKAVAIAAALAETIKADEAAIASLQLDLDHCRIVSPIAGRAGNLMVTAGNLIKADDVALVVINQISPIEVFFAIPQRDLDRVRANMALGGLAVEAAIPGELDRPEKGHLTFIDNAVDATSGTLQLGAVFPNENERLWPGRYVRVRLFLTMQKGVVAVPSRAVQTGSDGQFVFVVKADQTVTLRPVTVGRSNGDDAVIDHGLQPDEIVVTDGHLQLSDGTKVEIKPELGNATPEANSAAPATGEKRAKPSKRDPAPGPAAAAGVAP